MSCFLRAVNKFLKIKQEASGWLDWVGDDDEKRAQYLYGDKEGIQLDDDKIQKNPGRRSLTKMILWYSVWGNKVTRVK